MNSHIVSSSIVEFLHRASNCVGPWISVVTFICWPEHAVSINGLKSEAYLNLVSTSQRTQLVSTINIIQSILLTVILPFVLYGCEIWSLILKEECRLSVFENMVLRRIFGPERDEVTGEWRRLHNEERYALYSSPNIIWVINSTRLRWAGHVARVGERRCAYRALVGKPEGKRPLGRPRHR